MSEKINMPPELTAENGAKALLAGEFFERTEQTCLECYNEESSEDCPRCEGNQFIYVNVPISWDSIKRIYAMAAQHLKS